MGEVRRRGFYYCSKCGEKKKGHQCKMNETITFYKEDGDYKRKNETDTANELVKKIKELEEENAQLKKKIEELYWALQNCRDNMHPQKLFFQNAENYDFRTTIKSSVVYDNFTDNEMNRIVPHSLQLQQYNINTLDYQSNLNIKGYMQYDVPNPIDRTRNIIHYNTEQPKSSKDKESQSDINYSYNNYFDDTWSYPPR